MTYWSDSAMLYITKSTLERLAKSCILPFFKKCDPRITKNYKGITHLIPWWLWFMMLCFSTTLTQKLRKFLEKSKPFSEKSIHKFTDSKSLLNDRSSCKKKKKKCWGNTLVCRFLQDIWFHPQRETEANTSSLWSPKINYYHHNDAL